MKWLAGPLTLLLLTAPGCKRPTGPKVGDVVKRADNPFVTFVSENDPRIKKAALQAENSLMDFVQVLEAPKPTQTGMSIKAVFQDGDKAEGLWLTGLRYDGRGFRGVIANEPVLLKNVHLGAKVAVEQNKVKDWMYVESGRLHGGYSIRAVRELMKHDDRRRFDLSAPYAFD